LTLRFCLSVLLVWFYNFQYNNHLKLQIMKQSLSEPSWVQLKNFNSPRSKIREMADEKHMKNCFHCIKY
jgi:hypothetical protein